MLTVLWLDSGFLSMTDIDEVNGNKHVLLKAHQKKKLSLIIQDPKSNTEYDIQKTNCLQILIMFPAS